MPVSYDLTLASAAPSPVFGGAEPLLTIAAAAASLDVHIWALRRAVKRGDVPSYRGFNSRRLVRLSEVVAAINSTKTGGVN